MIHSKLGGKRSFSSERNFLDDHLDTNTHGRCFQEGKCLEAADLYHKYGAPPYPQNFNLYKQITSDVFGRKGLDNPESYLQWARLRSMLLSLVRNSSTTEGTHPPPQWLPIISDDHRGHESYTYPINKDVKAITTLPRKVRIGVSNSFHLLSHHFQTEALRADIERNAAVEEFEKLLTVCHYYALRCACKNVPSLAHISVKVSIALLRYTDIIPADKAYFEAGINARVSSTRHILKLASSSILTSGAYFRRQAEKRKRSFSSTIISIYTKPSRRRTER